MLFFDSRILGIILGGFLRFIWILDYWFVLMYFFFVCFSFLVFVWFYISKGYQGFDGSGWWIWSGPFRRVVLFVGLIWPFKIGFFIFYFCWWLQVTMEKKIERHLEKFGFSFLLNDFFLTYVYMSVSSSWWFCIVQLGVWIWCQVEIFFCDACNQFQRFWSSFFFPLNFVFYIFIAIIWV